MTPDAIIEGIVANRPGAEFTYQGDGRLEQHTTESGGEAAGLIWHGDDERPTDGEIARWAETALFARRGREIAETILVRLAESDGWAARAFEEGTQMPANRIAYRQQLRALRTTALAATTQAAVDALVIPDPPAAPQT